MNGINNFRRFGVMLDNSRNAVMKPEAIKKYIDIMSRLGYNCLMLYTEDTYEIDTQPYFGYTRGRFSGEEIKDIDAYAKEKGIELIPCIQTLAHINAIFRWAQFNDVHDCNDILLCGEEKTYALIDDMFRNLSENFTSKTVNIGMDEAFMLGRGNYLEKHGFENRFDILMTHLCRVSEIAKKYDFELIMWGDMFFRLLNSANGGDYYSGELSVSDEVKALVPDNVNLIYWDYYSHDKEKYSKCIEGHSAIKENIWFAGGLWSWSGFAPHNRFSFKATEAAFSACIDHGVKDVFLTMWGDNGGECSRFALLPSLYYASQLAKGVSDMDTIKAGFKEEFGMSFDDFMLLDMTGTPNDNEGTIINSDKYFLYNDCFMGLFDLIDNDNDEEKYARLAERIENAEINEEYAVIFDSMKKLNRVLEVKRVIGVKTRAVYNSKDLDAVRALLPEYDRLYELIEDFYNAYEKQWMWENKPHGFDVQDIRLGGLLRRVKHCRERLLKYADGKIDKIEELDEKMLPFAYHNGYFEYNNWALIATSNVI